ncbi:Yip1 family protein [Lihuaxuella thermophila]|uniref:Yip1 domain-containing protein n=1 Tax=Lihuaxuella thermophila TaxID=1173111 RepID=A0A1H8HSN3_9BACL|nr:Yip1 family protein [Lihuaxuella thermophila]SEN59123.1 Yip1 domain-containing protein [Lihuaxuella thermophila]
MNLQAQTPSTPKEKPSLLGIITSPEKQFLRIKDHPTVWGPMILLTLVTTLITGIQMYFVVNDPVLFPGMVDPSGNLTGELDMLKTITVISGTVGALFIIPLGSLVGALFTWILVLLFQGEAKYRQLLSFGLHLMVLNVLSLLVNFIALIGFGINPLEGSVTSLAAILPVEGMLKGFLTVLDVFMIWGLFLTANGLKVIAKLSSGKAWTISLLFFIVTALIYGVTYTFNSVGV